MLRAWLVLGVVFSVSGWAQSLARLTGTIADNSGAVVSGARVTARNVSTGVITEAASGESGIYQFPFLPPAEYEVSCELQGFKKSVRPGVVLETGSTRTLDFTLEVGELTESVEVKATVPLLEAETSSVGQFIERTTVMNMPLESRRTAGLVRLMGMVAFKQENAGEQIPIFSMAGGRSQNQMWNLDGAVVQNMALGVAQIQLNPPSESLQEFKAEASNYSAEYGRTANGLILMTTRSGSNAFHGAAYEFFRNQALDTRTFFAADKAPLRYNIFGGSFGGPIRRDRTFLFANYEGARRRDGQTIANTIVPHPNELRGDFSARRDLIVLDPVTRQAFPGNIIPENRIDPVARAFAALYPAPNIANNDITRAPGANYVVNVSDAITQDYGTLRVDHNIGEADRINVRYSIAKAPQSIAAVYPDADADLRAGIRENRIHNLAGTWIRTLSPSFINEFRYGWSNRMHINQATGFGSGTNSSLGLEGVDGEDFGMMSITGLSALGVTPHRRIQDPILTHQLVDNVTIIKGKHSIKTGFELRYSLNKDDLRQSSGGTFTFNDRATGSGTASFLLGHVTGASLVVTDLIEARTDYYGVFVQDDYKVSKNLTLNLGLRWELDTPRWERADNRQSGFAFDPINPVSGTRGVLTFSGRDGLSKYSHDFDKNNFSPRIGLAYRAPAGFLLRAGYGLVYSGAYAGAVPNAFISGFSLNGSFNSPDGGLTQAFFLRDGMPAITRPEIGPGFGAVRVGQAPVLSPDYLQQDHVNPYAHQYNFTIQKEVGGSMLMEVAYLGNLGHKLGGPNVNINQIPLVNGRGPAAQSQTARPFPQYNNVMLVSPPWGNSTYHALNVKLEKRYSAGLNFLVNYTWSKFLDDVEGNGELAGSEGNGYTHIERRAYDKSYSGNDIRHRVIGSTVYELPVGKNRRMDISNPILNAVIGGWSLGFVAELRSGAPWGAIEQTNLTNTFSAANRPNLVCDSALDSGRSRAEMVAMYFNTSCFTAPPAREFGNAARNVGFGPGFIGIDSSLTKRWELTETWRFQFRGDFLNLPNRANFNVPNTVRGRGDFGRITSTIGTGRQIQLSARLEF
ncbi:MAG TPA: TonB-dependent receptor [Bryobacteraceae bacterium]|nr:TonB-dependent receptor [Bryobacteraceae bacterium]